MSLSYKNKATCFKLLHLLLFFALNPLANIYSEVEIPYVSDFEIVGSELPVSWTATSNSAIITNNRSYSGGQSVRIASADPENIVSLDFDPSNSSVLFVDYYAQLTASDLPNLPILTTPATTSLVRVQPNGSGRGEWVFFHGGGDGYGTWVSSGDPVDLINSNNTRTEWHRITLRLDLTSNSWDVYIDGQLLAVNLGFAEPMSSGSEAINIYGSSTGTDFLDTFSLTISNPLNSLVNFTDTDLDGMDDSFEATYGLNTSIDDRDLDPDFDGRTNIEEYLHGTDPFTSNVTTVSLPAGSTLTEVKEVNGNLEVVTDGSIRLSKPLNEISGLDINGANSSNNVDILLSGTLNGFLKVQNITGNVTFKSALNINGDLDVAGVNNILFDNSSINVTDGNIILGALNYISLTNNSVVTATNGYFIIQRCQEFTLEDSTMSLNKVTLFLQVQNSLGLIRSAIDIEGGIAQLSVFVDAIIDEYSSLIVNNGDLYAQVNRNLTVGNNSQVMVTEGNIGLNVIGDALVNQSSRLELRNSTVSEKSLQLIVSGTTTFDNDSVLAVKDAELNIFSFDNINLFNSTLSVLPETVLTNDTFIRTNANLVLTNSELLIDSSNLSINVAESMYAINSDIAVNNGNLYLNTREDLIMDSFSALNVTGGDLYANVFGGATLGGSIDLGNLFAMYVQGTFTLTKNGSLNASIVYLSSGYDIVIYGQMNTSKVDGKVYLVSQNIIDMRESEYPIISGLLSTIANNGIFLRTEVDSLTVQALAAGAEIEVYEEDDVTVDNAYNQNGSIHLIAGGSIALVDVTTDDLTVTENYNAIYTVTFDLGSYGTRTGGGALTQTVGNGESAIAPEVSGISGWVFTGWDVDFDSVVDDLIVTAQYEPEIVNNDTDNDGFNDLDESRLKTNPQVSNLDTDSDGIPDEIENLYVSLDPNLATDILDDYDEDGIPNIFEVYNNSNPDDPTSVPVLEESSVAYFKVDASRVEANTFAKITEAATAAQDYNYAIIEVLPGYYIENVSLASSVLLIAPQGSDNTVLRSPNSADKALTILDLCVLDGFTTRYDQDPPIELDSTEQIIIKNCSIISDGINPQLTNGGGVSKSGGIVDIINCYMPEATR